MLCSFMHINAGGQRSPADRPPPLPSLSTGLQPLLGRAPRAACALRPRPHAALPPGTSLSESCSLGPGTCSPPGVRRSGVQCLALTCTARDRAPQPGPGNAGARFLGKVLWNPPPSPPLYTIRRQPTGHRSPGYPPPPAPTQARPWFRGKSAEIRRTWTGPYYRVARTTEHMLQAYPAARNVP